MLKCLGIYLKGSGAEFIWIDADMYGPSVIENSILDAGNYNWALHGMSLLAECISRLALKVFLHDKEDQYAHAFKQLKQLRTPTDQRDNSAGKKLVEGLSQSKLLSDHSNFTKEKVPSNEHYSVKAISCLITATSSRRRYQAMKTLLIGNTSKKYSKWFMMRLESMTSASTMIISPGYDTTCCI